MNETPIATIEHSLSDEPYRDEPNDDLDVNEEFLDEVEISHERPPSPISNTHRQRSKTFWAVGVCLCVLLVIVVASLLVSLEQRMKEEELSSFLTAQGVASSAETFQDASSPQSKAVRWLVTEDSMKLTTQSQNLVQRYLAALFVFSLVPAIEMSDFQEKYQILSGVHHECDWQSPWQRRGDSSKIYMGFHCNDDREMDRIVLPNVGLTGAVPTELEHISTLKRLVLDSNKITGALPLVSSLTSLSISHNVLSGTIPSDIAKVSKLRTLVLAENFFTGRLPEELQGLQKLKRFSFSGNAITGGIQNIFNLETLEEVYGGFNSLRDGLDDASFGKLTDLKVLNLRNNKLEGPFPDALWALPNLKIADFHFNALDGHLNDIPEETKPVLQHLDVSENFLGGGLPPTLNRLNKLTHLDVSSNRFEKPLPGDLGGMTSLQTLLMTDNGEFGPQPIPSWLQMMPNLKHLSMKLTARTGEIPDWLPQTLTNLELLDLDWNHLEGSIPSELSLLTNLRHLLVNRNWFSGTFPTEVASLPDLKTLMVDNNSLTGNLVACQAATSIADCGDVKEGCPDCQSVTMEISCPCCSDCCFDEEEYCNTGDWLNEILEMELANEGISYDYKYHPTEYTPKDIFEPAQR